MKKFSVISLSLVLLLSCAAPLKAPLKKTAATDYIQGKNEWQTLSTPLFYPQELADTIETYLGIPYLWGGDTREGMDCSAFTRRIFRIYGIELPRVSILQSKIGIKIPKHALLAGDLVFFGDADSVTHVGIYMGKNTFANATTSAGIKYSNLDEPSWLAKYLFARRIKR
ncbi:hypothetical protein AGMMS49938_01040 [Fibrobacterales bacterium]|nr:hypothetical protein AGMMS49938_01040 [Fibrobacterales bacterium]